MTKNATVLFADDDSRGNPDLEYISSSAHEVNISHSPHSPPKSESDAPEKPSAVDESLPSSDEIKDGPSSSTSPSPSSSPSPSPKSKAKHISVVESPTSSNPSPSFDQETQRHRRHRRTTPDLREVQIKPQSVPEQNSVSTAGEATESMSARSESGGVSGGFVAFLTIGSALVAFLAGFASYKLWQRVQLNRYRGWMPYDFELVDF